MDSTDALERLNALADPEKGAQMAAYHKAERRYLGVPNGALDEMVRDWRRTLDLDARIDLARALWDSDIHEARVAAAKLLTQARIRPDDGVWALITSWVGQFDGWAVADHACIAGQKRVVADPGRLDEIEGWTISDHMWTKRAALVITLPFARAKFPKPDEIAARERVLGWAAGYVEDKDWFIQKCVAWWLRELSRRDTARVETFLEAHGAQMKGFARREAGKYLG